MQRTRKVDDFKFKDAIVFHLYGTDHTRPHQFIRPYLGHNSNLRYKYGNLPITKGWTK